MNFYKRFLGDYARDTTHLTLVEHGVYTVLLDTYYATGLGLPAARDALYRIAKAMTAQERKAVDKVADQFFPVNGDGTRHNPRADEEISKWEKQAEHNRAVGPKGGRPRKPGNNPDGNPEITRELTRELTRKEPGNNPSHSHSQSKPKTKGSTDPSSEPAVPDCPQQAILGLYAKHLPMLSQPRLWEGKRAELLRSRWRQCAKANAVWPGYTTEAAGLEFWDRFFAGVAQSAVLTAGIERRDGPTWKPDLPWLLKAENFIKVIEGKYHP